MKASFGYDLLRVVDNMRQNCSSYIAKCAKLFHTPIYVYQMGKVGSSSLEATIESKAKGVFAKPHAYCDMSANKQIWLTTRLRCHLPVNVICPIREPISRNVSAFFESFYRDTGYKFSDRDFSLLELKELFLNCYYHNEPLEWFDRHMQPVFNFDVYQEAFPIERKWKIYTSGSSRILIYRTDLDRKSQIEIVSDFLKIRFDKWAYANVSEGKEYRELYKEFISSVKLPDIYLRLINESRFSRHFWSDNEREAHASVWRDGNGER